MQCYAKHIQSKCGALNTYWQRVLPPLEMDGNQTVLINKTEKETSACIGEFVDQRKPSCPCRIPCEETRYDAQIEKYKDFLLNEDPIISLQIYFETREITKITEVLSYDTTRFLADIGGLIGLLIGMSVLSVFEVLFCIVLYIVDCVLLWKNSTF